MKRNLPVSFFFYATIFTALLTAGCSSFQNIELKDDYGFQNKNTITVYVAPSGKENLDDTYARVTCLDLQATGYKVFNANEIIKADSEKIPWINHRQVADALINNRHIPNSDIIAVIKVKWDSVSLITYYSEKSTVNGELINMKGINVLRLSSEAAFYDHFLKEPVMSFSAVDTANVMLEKEGSELYYPEYSWMIVARQLTKNLKSIKVCTNDNLTPATNTYKISFWVDKSYREAFPHEWMDRLKLRVLYANDILCNQLGIQLVISDFKEWDSYFDTSLERTLEKLKGRLSQNSNTLRIGITLNKKLKTNWTDKADLGLAYPFTTDAIITAQPTFPGLEAWSPIEEARTLAHEIGHLFGAVHVNDMSSIMYPLSGSLEYELDDLNKKIIELTKYNFLKRDNELHLKQYANNLIEIKNTNPLNTVAVLEPISFVFMNLFSDYSYNFNDYGKINKFLFGIISDSVYSLAVTGYVEYKLKAFMNAQKLFTRVVELDPEFAEAHFYLSKILKRIGEADEAEKHYQIAKPYLKYWVINND